MRGSGVGSGLQGSQAALTPVLGLLWTSLLACCIAMAGLVLVPTGGHCRGCATHRQVPVRQGPCHRAARHKLRAYNSDQGAPGARLHSQRRWHRQQALPACAGSSRSVLDAFFYGRAFAQVLNEKLGELADDLLVQVSKLDAQRQQAFRCARPLSVAAQVALQQELSAAQARATGAAQAAGLRHARLQGILRRGGEQGAVRPDAEHQQRQQQQQATWRRWASGPAGAAAAGQRAVQRAADLPDAVAVPRPAGAPSRLPMQHCCVRTQHLPLVCQAATQVSLRTHCAGLHKRPHAQEAVDELRAEVAAARAQVTSFRASKPSSTLTASTRAARR